jgi:NADH dehydrogenase
MSSPNVVVGGGFAGFWAAVAARRVAPAVDVVLVSRTPMLEMRPRLYEAEPAGGEGRDLGRER